MLERWFFFGATTLLVLAAGYGMVLVPLDRYTSVAPTLFETNTMDDAVPTPHGVAFILGGICWGIVGILVVVAGIVVLGAVVDWALV